MEPVKLTKKEVDKMMEIKGNVRGNILKGHFAYIEETKGKEGIKKVKKRLSELGFSVKENDFITTKWYSEALSCLIILVFAEVYKLEEKEVFKMAYNSAKYSLIIRIFMQYFLNIEKVFRTVSSIWRKHFDFGEMKVVEFDNKQKFGTIRLYGFQKYHPLICIYHMGYFTKIAELAHGSKKIKVEHPKCLFDNYNYEEFKISWQ